MDRFIEVMLMLLSKHHLNLKSSMDRFIATKQAVTISVIPRFKIQYG